MKLRIIKHARALEDLEQRVESIYQHNPRAALRFLDAAEATIRLVAASPGSGVRYAPDHPALAGLRFIPITRFRNDLVFYLPLADGIQVLRVLHGTRDIHHILAEDLGVDEVADEPLEEGDG